MGRVPPERALQIVTKAAQEANDVIQATQADPLKKPKQMKQATKDAVARCVESGDPAQVVAYIKANRKEFISGVYQSWFMKEIRKSLEGGQDGGLGGYPRARGRSRRRRVPSGRSQMRPTLQPLPLCLPRLIMQVPECPRKRRGRQWVAMRARPPGRAAAAPTAHANP